MGVETMLHHHHRLCLLFFFSLAVVLLLFQRVEPRSYFQISAWYTSPFVRTADPCLQEVVLAVMPATSLLEGASCQGVLMQLCCACLARSSLRCLSFSPVLST
jgi:hypothetical protein